MEDIQNLFKKNIAEFMENGLDAVSDTTVSRVTDKILPIAKEWQQRPREAAYVTVDETAPLDALDTFSERWDKKYPKISRSWRDHWTNLSTYFKFPQEVRRLTYTTNTIEGVNRQLQKVTKSKFPSLTAPVTHHCTSHRPWGQAG